MTTNFLSRISRFHVPAVPADVVNTSIETAYTAIVSSQPAQQKILCYNYVRFGIGFILLNVIHLIIKLFSEIAAFYYYKGNRYTFKILEGQI